MAGLVALASYPKSGNTWLRAFLSAVLTRTNRVDINRLRIPNFADRVLYDRFLGINSSDFTTAELSLLRARLYAFVTQTYEQDFLIKVHDAWLRSSHTGQPPVPPDLIRKVIYIVRDPRDVAISFAGHLGKSIDEAIRLMTHPGFTLWTNPRERLQQLPQLIAGWSQHVSSWLGSGHERVLLVRYEDMLANPQRLFGNVLGFLGAPLAGEALRAAVAAVSFDELSRQEVEVGFRERPPTNKGRFFRTGRARGWQVELTPDQARRIVRDHGEVMRRLGYETDHYA